MSLTVCFIDDSPFERDLFSRVYGDTRGWDLVIAETYSQAREMLGDRIPLLWLLDLWGNDPAGTDPVEIIDLQELKAKAGLIRDLDSVWEGLAEFPGDRPNEFLKRLYTIVSGWSGLFMEAASAADQTKAYGLFNLERVREDYPNTAALAYTRKSQSTDLAAYLAAGGDGILLKPHGPDDAAILKETKRQAPVLADRMQLVLSRCLEASLLRQALILGGPEGAYFFSLAGALSGRSPLPPERILETEPYLIRWAGAIREWLKERLDQDTAE